MDRQLQKLKYIYIYRRYACAMLAGHPHLRAAHACPVPRISQIHAGPQHHINRHIVAEERRHSTAMLQKGIQSRLIKFKRRRLSHADNHGRYIHIGMAKSLQEQIGQRIHCCFSICRLAAQSNSLEQLISSQDLSGSPVTKLIGLKALQQEALQKLARLIVIQNAGFFIFLIERIEVGIHPAHGNTVPV